MWNEDASQGKPHMAVATMGLLSTGLKISFKVQGYVIFFGDQLTLIQA